MKAKKDLFFYIGLFLLSIATYCINVVYIQDYIFYIKLFSILCFSINIFINVKQYNLNYKKIIAILLLFLIGLLSYYITKDIMLFYTMLIMLSSYILNFNKIVKYDLIIKLFTIGLVIISYFLNLTNELEIHRLDGRLRYSLGFSHPNTLAIIILFCYVSYLYLKKDKINFKHILFGVVIDFLIITLTDSRTAFLLLSVIIMIIGLKKYVNKLFKNKLFHFFAKYFFVILFFISIILTINYSQDNKLLYYINNLLSNRLAIQYNYLNSYNVSLLGSFIDNPVSLDCFYIKYLLYYGLFGIAFFSLIYYETIKKAYSEKNYLIYYLFIILSLYCIAENVVFSVYYNIFVLYVFSKKRGIKL